MFDCIDLIIEYKLISFRFHFFNNIEYEYLDINYFIFKNNSILCNAYYI